MLIYDALKRDHEEVKSLLEQLVNLKESTGHQRHVLIEKIVNELVPHARAEEVVFYNSLRQIDAAKDIAMHGFEEHIEAENLLRTLQVKDKIDADWKDTAFKLRDAIEHHIREEETKIFSVAQQLFTNEEAEAMTDAFERLKPEVRNEGFLKQTIDMIANLMPTRVAASIRGYNLDQHT